MVEPIQVPGKEVAHLKLYTLSTCGWCKKMKALLRDMGIAYEYIDVDLLPEPEKEVAMGDLEKWNPRCSFPTLVVNEQECIIGFSEEKIREVVGK